MRNVIILESVQERIDELQYYLLHELKLSEEFTFKRIHRMRELVATLSLPVDYAPCRFRRWRELGYRCVMFDRSWVFAYEVLPEGVIIRDMQHAKALADC